MVPPLLSQLVLRARKEANEGAHEEEDDDSCAAEEFLEIGEGT